MTRLFLRRALLAVVVAGSATALGACNEQLDAGSACPSLCPGLSVPIKDTTFSPVLAFDTTIVGYPSIGTENGIPLASRGDTLDVRGVVRFDSLTTIFAPPGDSVRPVTNADTVILRLRLNLTQSRLPASVRFEVYDVDTTADDANNAAVLSLFTPARLVTSKTLTRAEITDSIVLPLSSSWLMNKMNTGSNVRFGLRLVSSGSVSLRVHTTETGLSPEIRYYVWPDTTVKQIVVTPYSKTPVQPPSVANDYRDYAIVARNGLPPAGSTLISTGGLPARRAYLRFDVPQWLLDSTTIVRATLQLTQAPQRGFDQSDSLTVVGEAVAATNFVGELYRAADLFAPEGLFVSDSIHVAPADTGVRVLEMNALLRVWKSAGTSTLGPQRAVVLMQREEGLHGAEVRFFGSRSPAAVRPRLRVSYIPRVTYGVP